MQCPECTQRVRNLRNYYMKNSPVSVVGYPPWKVQRTMMLFYQGWREGVHQPTTRLRRAYGEQYMQAHMEPIIDPEELIVGQPDLHPLSDTEQVLHDQYDDIYRNVIPPNRGRADHMGLDYGKLLQVGVHGLLDEIHANDAKLDLFNADDLAKHEFNLGCEMELQGLLMLAQHYVEKARAMAQEANEPRKSELLEIARVLEKVPANPAETLREALQSVHFYTFSLLGIYSAGRPDQYLYPYFRHDMDNGILTLSQAQELLDCFCLHYITNMCSWAAAGFEVGGRTRDGKAVENELTWMFLESIRHTRSADPSVGLAVTSETSPELLKYAAEIVAEGHTHPAFWNDQGITDSMIRNGYSEYDAHWWTHSTCVEITPIAKSGVSITSPYVNVLKVLLDALDEAQDGISFDDLIELFRKHMNAQMVKDIYQENMWQMERSRNGNDPFRASCLTDNCIALGKSHECGGAPYNFIEPNMLGMLNTIESLNIIWNLVYVEKRLSLSKFREICKSNYENQEELRQYIIRKLPHFGNNETFSDALAKRVSDIVLESCSPLRSYRGAKIIPGAFSYREHAIQGRLTPASPDGRKACMPLTSGSDPVQGYDTSGPTASLLSTAMWQPTRFLGGTAVNMKLAKNTPNLSDVIVSLVKTYMQIGGSELQISIADTDTLLAAQTNPEAYQDLLVRIGGYSDFFVRIDKDMQDEIIRRACFNA